MYEEQNIKISDKDKISIPDISIYLRLQYVSAQHRAVVTCHFKQICGIFKHTHVKIPTCVTLGKLLKLYETQSYICELSRIEGTKMCIRVDFQYASTITCPNSSTSAIIRHQGNLAGCWFCSHP